MAGVNNSVLVGENNFVREFMDILRGMLHLDVTSHSAMNISGFTDFLL